MEISNSGKFRCINPKHKDNNPSAHFIPDTEETKFKCFSCGAGGDILDAARLLENKPQDGQDFVQENLAYIADKYAVEYATVDLTAEELHFRRTCKAYDDASDIATSMFPLEYATKRNWPKSVCTDLGIGVVKSYADFISQMEARGYDRPFCESVDLNSNIFSDGMLIFTIKNEHGRVVGFSARDMAYSKDCKRPKFINTSAKCPLYNKSAILYGIDIGRKNQPPLYIFEGYPDYVTAYKHGIKNTCAIGGTALTRDHIALLKTMGINQIILALDGDDAGQNRTEGLLDEYFGGDETLSVSILALPDKLDPDEYINKFSSDEFLKLPTLTPFQWRLTRFSYEDKPDFICDKMVPIIIADINETHRWTKSKELAEKTGIPFAVVWKQVEKQVNKEEAARDNLVQNKVKQLINDLKFHKGDPAELLQVTVDEIRQVSHEVKEDLHSSNEVITSMDEIYKSFKDRTPGLQGWKTGYDMLDSKLSGIPKKDAMITFAGDSNIGKTGFMFELALRLARYNENIMVLFMTIDDSRTQAIARLVALESGLKINQVSHPKNNIKTEEDRQKLLDGWAKVRRLVDGNKFSIKDNTHGDNLDFAEGWIKWAQKNHPSKEICFFLDNFHKLGDERGGDERLRFKHASSRIHGMKNKLGITAVCTMELRKMIGGNVATRPSLQDISESKQMEYDNNLIGMVYSDVHARREDAKIFWDGMDGDRPVKRPVLEIDFQKNKVSDYKGVLYWKFAPEYSRFDEESEERIAEWQKEYSAALQHVSDKRNPVPGRNPFTTGTVE